MEKEIYPFDVEWMEMVHNIMNNGGKLWVIERTDTNQFMVRTQDLRMRTSHDLPASFNPYEWQDVLPQMSDGLLFYMTEDYYPTKELADKYAPKEIREGGCSHCGNGSTLIPIKLTEHEFVNSSEDK